MSRTVIVAHPARSVLWRTALEHPDAEIHEIDPPRALAGLFQQDPASIVILDIEQAHSSTAMLIPQIKHIWPACQLLAVVPEGASQPTDLLHEGLWAPHQVLVRPINARVLYATVALMRARREAKLLTETLHSGKCPSAAALTQNEFRTPSIRIPDELL